MGAGGRRQQQDACLPSVALLRGASRPKTAAAPLFRGSPLRRKWVGIRESPPSRKTYPMTPSPDTLIYCFKCRTKTESNDLEQVVLKNRRDATRAVCAVCGNRKFRLGKLG